MDKEETKKLKKKIKSLSKNLEVAENKIRVMHETIMRDGQKIADYIKQIEKLEEKISVYQDQYWSHMRSVLKEDENKELDEEENNYWYKQYSKIMDENRELEEKLEKKEEKLEEKIEELRERDCRPDGQWKNIAHKAVLDRGYWKKRAIDAEKLVIEGIEKRNAKQKNE